MSFAPAVPQLRARLLSTPARAALLAGVLALVAPACGGDQAAAPEDGGPDAGSTEATGGAPGSDAGGDDASGSEAGDASTGDATAGDAAPSSLFTNCPSTGHGCDLPSGTYVPVALGPAERVWIPPDGRYVNEPTLIRADDGTWHLFSNGATGGGGPWVETQIIHATAPRLAGPWTAQPDVLSTRDPGAVEMAFHAPFVLRDGDGWRILWFDASIRTAHSIDLFAWQRTGLLLGNSGISRDPFVLRLPDGSDLLYLTGTEAAADGSIHDTVELYEGHGLGDWGARQVALRNPAPCPAGCWGWYESSYVVEVGGQYFLFSTFTSSLPDRSSDYRRTVVFRSPDPRHFTPTPIATLEAHGGELVVEDGHMYLTSGGWPTYVGEEHRGLSVTPIGWKREN